MLQLFDKNTINSLSEENTMIFDAGGSLLYNSTEKKESAYPEELFSQLKHEVDEIRFADGKYEVIASKLIHQNQSYYVITEAFDRFGKSKLQFLGGLLIASFLIVTILCFTLSIYLSKRITQPVSDLTRQIANMSAANLSVRITEVTGEDEIGYLAESFNQLLAKVEDAFKFQFHFVHHVSHELKTPLAVMMSNAERALFQRDFQGMEDSLKFQVNALMDVSHVIDAILDISKTENKISCNSAESIRIDELLFECIEEIKYFDGSGNFNFFIDRSVENSDSITVSGNNRMLKMALMNLMKNAVNYLPIKKLKLSLVQMKIK